MRIDLRRRGLLLQPLALWPESKHDHLSELSSSSAQSKGNGSTDPPPPAGREQKGPPSSSSSAVVPAAPPSSSSDSLIAAKERESVSLQCPAVCVKETRELDVSFNYIEHFSIGGARPIAGQTSREAEVEEGTNETTSLSSPALHSSMMANVLPRAPAPHPSVALLVLNLGGNRLTSFPSGLSCVPLLEELYLNNNSITSMDVLISDHGTDIGKCTPLLSRLRVLDLRQNRVRRLCLPSYWASSLEHLCVSSNALTRVHWPSFPSPCFQRLKHFGFGGNAALALDDLLELMRRCSGPAFRVMFCYGTALCAPLEHSQGGNGGGEDKREKGGEEREERDEGGGEGESEGGAGGRRERRDGEEGKDSNHASAHQSCFWHKRGYLCCLARLIRISQERCPRIDSDDTNGDSHNGKDSDKTTLSSSLLPACPQPVQKRSLVTQEAHAGRKRKRSAKAIGGVEGCKHKDMVEGVHPERFAELMWCDGHCLMEEEWRAAHELLGV